MSAKIPEYTIPDHSVFAGYAAFLKERDATDELTAFRMGAGEANRDAQQAWSERMTRK